MQSDPIGLMAGPNTFTYAFSQSLTFTDRYGLAGLRVTSSRTGQVIHSDPNHPNPCGTGKPWTKGKNGEKDMLQFLQGGGLGLGGTKARGNTANNVAPSAGGTGRARTDGIIPGIGGGLPTGLEAKCGPCAGFTPNQKQNYGPATTPGPSQQFDDIWVFWYR